jgi:hypothetical protein
MRRTQRGAVSRGARTTGSPLLTRTPRAYLATMSEEEEIVDRILRCLQHHLGDVWTADARRAAEHVYEDVVAPIRAASLQPVPPEARGTVGEVPT